MNQSNNGFVGMPRSVFCSKFHPGNEDRPYTKYEAELDLYDIANYADKTWHGILIKRGQLAFSRSYYERRWKWDRKKVQRFFKSLSSDHTIVLTPVHGITTIVTLCDYVTLVDKKTDKSEANVQGGGQDVTENCPPTIIETKQKDTVNKKPKEPPFFAADSPESQLTRFCIEKIKSNHPTVKFDSKRKQQIALMFADMVRIDKISLEKAKEIIIWVTSHNDKKTGFSWADQFMSPLKMRKSNRDGIRFTTMWLRQMAKGKGLLGNRPADMTPAEWDRVRDMPECEKCKTMEHMKIMSRSGRMSKWYCQKCNTSNTVQK
jgi:hypothetical protein